jgi:septum formation protein
MQLILASQSPRRKELLAHAGVPFKVIKSSYAEDNQLDCVKATVKLYAKEKGAEVYLKQSGNCMIISADTIVTDGINLYEKPKDLADAQRILSHLSGKEHQVYTAVSYFYRLNEQEFYQEQLVCSRVFFRTIPDYLMTYYLTSNEGSDKAGAYGIQAKGLLFIDQIIGSYSNVVGLPLSDVIKVLESIANQLGFNNYFSMFADSSC